MASVTEQCATTISDDLGSHSRYHRSNNRYLKEENNLTFLFTDIEGSTNLVSSISRQYPIIIKRYMEILRDETSRRHGREVDFHADTYFAVFDSPINAVLAALDAQLKLNNEDWPGNIELRVRIGLHTGTAILDEDPHIGYTGFDVHRAARICDAAHGGQVLLSTPTAEGVLGLLPPEAQLRDLGAHRLKDVPAPETLWQLVIEGLPDKFAALRCLDNRPNNLPETVTRFIGREKEVAQVRRLLLSEDVRIVTLTGAAGIGKTRLSVEVASSLRDTFLGGIFIVDLSAVSNHYMVLPSIAQALGIHEYPGQSAFETVRNYLTGRNVLLILDNFEQIIGSAGTVVAMMSSCKTTKALLTSREPLNVSMEHEYRMSPLAVPSEGLSAESVLTYDSIRLFIDRLKRVKVEFVVKSDHVLQIAQICRRLDGIPLAIELATSRLRLLELPELHKRLLNGLKVLGQNNWSLGNRHETLFSSIQWSYNLLSDFERKVFRKISVFFGAFDVDQGIELCSEEMGEDRAIDALESLLRKSLIQREIINSEPCLRMLQPVREYALTQLSETGDVYRARRCHMTVMLSRVEAASPDFNSSRRGKVLPPILARMSDIRGAIEFGLAHSDSVVVSRFLNALLWLWISRGQFSEGESWITRALELTASREGTAVRARVLDVAAWFRLMSGDWVSARPFFQQCALDYQNLGMAPEARMATMMKGITTAVGTNEARDLNQVHAALVDFRERNDRFGIGLTVTALGEAARLQGEYPLAKVYFDEALACMRDSDNIFWIGALLQNLAQINLHASDWRVAVTLLSEMLELASECEDPLKEAYYFATMGHVAILRDNYIVAANLFGAASNVLRNLGVSFEPADQAAFERNIRAGKAMLGSKAFTVYFDEGTQWDRTQALFISASLRD